MRALGRMRGSRMPARRAPPFLPEEMGGKKGRGASPTLDPPIRGFMAAESCTDKARTGRASTPGSFFGFVTGAAAPWAARIGITPQALKVVALYRLGPPGRRRCHAAEGPGCPSQPAGNCSLCRGGYHPPVCPRNCWLRGARRPGAPSVGRVPPCGTGRRGRRPLHAASWFAVGVGPLADPPSAGCPLSAVCHLSRSVGPPYMAAAPTAHGPPCLA